MTDLIETTRIREVIDRIKEDADRRRYDAIQCPPLANIYTAMAFASDEIIARLESLLTAHTLKLAAAHAAQGDKV
jgi:hypothetical protein